MPLQERGKHLVVLSVPLGLEEPPWAVDGLLHLSTAGGPFYRTPPMPYRVQGTSTRFAMSPAWAQEALAWSPPTLCSQPPTLCQNYTDSEFAGCGWEVKARLFLRCHASKLLCLPSGIPPVSILFNCHLLILFSSACFFSSQDLFVVLCWFLLNYSSLEEKSFPEPATQKAPSIYFRWARLFLWVKSIWVCLVFKSLPRQWKEKKITIRLNSLFSSTTSVTNCCL